MGHVLEPTSPGSQGCRSRQNGKQTRGVEKGKLLEIYTAKEREGFINARASVLGASAHPPRHLQTLQYRSNVAPKPSQDDAKMA